MAELTNGAADAEFRQLQQSASESGFRFVRNRSTSIVRSSVDPSYLPKYLTKFGSVDSNIEDVEGVKKVLVLNTGGTIAMIANEDGVYEPLPKNSFVPELRRLPIFHDSESDVELPEECLILKTAKSQPVVYSIYEYDPLLDSCNMTMDDWVMLAKDINRNYHKFDGFVILHGTDTMAYTASALAFILENLGKPVILTGSQIPIFEPRSDGRDNFIGALTMAGQYCIPEVCLYFNDSLLRGCRATKIDNESFRAFSSPNLGQLATIGIDIKIHWNEVFKPYSIEKFCISTKLCPNVGVLRLFPSISVQTVHLFLQPPMQGVVIQSYGAGNGPSARKDLMDEFIAANNRGVILLNISQCPHGAVTVSYETGAALAGAGIIAGSDMTPEAALTKLSYVLGKDVSLDEKKAMMGRNLRGELRSTAEDKVTLSSHSLIEKIAQTMRISSEEETATIRDVIYPSMMCDAAKHGNIDSIRKLIETGGQVVQHCDYDCRTPLHVAVSAGKLETAQFLLNNGALVHVRDIFGDTPLMNAIYFGYEDITKLLVKAGAHLTLPRVKLGCQLYAAAVEGRTDRLRCWLAAGADMNAVDLEGRSVVHAAAAVDNLGVVDWLREQDDIDLCQQDNLGHTPVDVAMKLGHNEIVSELKKAMLVVL